MARVVRRRRIAAPVGEVWELVSDPYHLPRWWPRTTRVENVHNPDGPAGSAWTQVLETKNGRAVRADYRCLSAAENERFVFEQQLENTPFERVLRSARIDLRLRPEGPETEVELAQEQKLRGLSRFGSPLMRRATGQILDEALAALDEALGGEKEEK